MKTLKKALALVLALSVTAMSGSALAAVEGTCTISGGSSSFTASYNASARSLTATAAGAKVGEQMTFLILDRGTDVTNITEGKILHVDQKEATADDKSFTGTINLSRVSGASGEMPDGSYPVRFGYYNSAGNFQLGVGNLVISTIVPAAVNSVTTDATANATAGSPITITATVDAVGGASTAYTWTVTSRPAGSTANPEGNSFTPDKVGTYVLRATSDFDSTKYDEKTITVVDSSPTLTSASIDGDSSAYTDETVTLTGSFVNSGKPGVTLTWSVEGGATLSATEGATTVVTPSGVGTVTVTLTATSETGVVKTDTHEIEFSVRPSGGTKISIVWGDVDADGSVATGDRTALLLRSIGGQTAFTKSGKTFTIGTKYDDITWGDVDADDALTAGDMTALLLRSIGGQVTFTNATTSKSYTIGNTYEITLPE